MNQNKVIHGDNLIMDILISGVYEEFACGTDMELSINISMVDRTSVGSGKWIEQKPKRRSWQVSYSLVTLLDVSEKTVFYLMDSSVMDNGLDIRITFVNRDGDFFYLTGKVFWTNLTINGNVTELSGSEVQLVGSGAYTLTAVGSDRAVLDDDGNIIYNPTNEIGNEVLED